MSERVILAVKFTPAGAPSQVRKAVGGFLRYVQHRDLHPTQAEGRPRPDVSGLLKYVAYRDRASTRAELFGPTGTLSSEDRKAFAGFVVNALDRSSQQLFRGRDGQMHDRRRAVYRLVISPERAGGLDLRRLTVAAVSRLEQASGMSDLRWIAAIHRNTAHHHVHLVVAGMHQDASGPFRRVDLTRPRLAAMKEALTHEIEHQRGERIPNPAPVPAASETAPGESVQRHSIAPARVHLVRAYEPRRTHRERGVAHHGSLIALRAVARRYQRRMQRELEESYLQSLYERAA
jgi:hypothetical protein